MGNNAENNDEISLIDLIKHGKSLLVYISSKWFLILLLSGIGGLLGFLYAYNKKTTFIAELSFVLEEQNSGGSLGGALGLASQFGLDLGSGGGDAFTGDNLMALLKSRTIVQKSLLAEGNFSRKKEILADRYINFSKISYKGNEKSSNFLTFKNYNPGNSRSKDSLLNSIYKRIISSNLSIEKVDKKLSIITIRVKTIDEAFSKEFAETLAKVVSNFYIETKTKKSLENLTILQRQTDSVRRQLNLALSGVAVSNDYNPNANAALQILKVPSQRRQVDVQANQAILSELVKNLESSRIALRKETPLIQIIDRPILPLEMDRIGKLKAMVIGAFVLGVLTVLLLVIRKILKQILLGSI
ncbi:lipopolysaccharide biosynthesis protein [Desertivirga arenae]|uniref:lipopolysaccharide biosynthesis protein n=1 Tax=Desertivirga arenae TaxID=2810309 RepID=UPI001A95BDDD|nr:lipopolysaccharide biosynthesis protein [Pedobacter sp. SYSU D00823]